LSGGIILRMIFEYLRDVESLPALLLYRTFFASKPLKGFRIGYRHLVSSFRTNLASLLEIDTAGLHTLTMKYEPTLQRCYLHRL
jgi:hypothetical protein